MFFDDINGLCVEISNLNCQIGYISDELPSMSGESTIFKSEDNKCYAFENLLLTENQRGKMQKIISDNKIQDFDLYQNLVKIMSKKIGSPYQQQPLLLITKNNDQINEERQQLNERFFEQDQLPCLYYANDLVCSLFMNGQYNGMVVNSGAYETTIAPINDGFLLKQKIKQFKFGGEQITEIFKNKIMNDVKNFETIQNLKLNQNYQQDDKNKLNQNRLISNNKQYPSDINLHFQMKIIRNIKECLLSIKKLSSDFKSQKQESENINDNLHVRLPDDQFIEFEESYLNQFENYFFKKKIENEQQIDLPLEIVDIIQSCDNYIKKDLLQKVFVTGGNSSIRNFKDILEQNLSQVQNLNSKIKVYSQNLNHERKFSSWIGGSLLSSTGTFQNMWISLQEYLEYGNNIVIRKCIN